MALRLIAACAVVMAVGASRVASQVPVVTPAAPPTVDTGAISGVVTDGVTGAPIEGALVSIVGGWYPPGRPVSRPYQMTDSKGRFIFTHLPPPMERAEYSLFATQSEYLSLNSPRLPALAKGQWFSEGHIKLWPAASISGTVRDERGEPLVGVPVRLLVGGTVAGRLRWASGPITQTDDRGMYRFGRLAKGRYLVHVPSIQISLPSGEVALYRPPANTAGAPSPTQTQDALHVMRRPDGSGVVTGQFPTPPPDEKGSVYPSAFPPAVRSLDQAEPLALEYGENRTVIDVQMAPAPSVSVSGTVIGPAESVAGIAVRILPTGNEQLGLAGDTGLTKADAAGRFILHRVPAGDYVIVASRSAAEYEVYVPVGPRPVLLPAGANPFANQMRNRSANGMVLNSSTMGGADVTGRLQITVGDRSLSDLVVPVTPAVSVSGHFEWDGSETPPASNMPGLPVPVLEPADGEVTLGAYFGNVVPPTADAPAARIFFRFENVKPGRYVIGNLTTNRIDRLVGATWNGRDVIDTPIEVSGDGPVTGLVVKLSMRRNQVTGTVRSADGRVATEGAVIAFPPTPASWRVSGFSAIRFRSGGVSADGTYELPAMISGDYLLAAIPIEDLARSAEPAFLAAIAREATRVTLGPASTLSQDLRVINTKGVRR